MIDFIVIKDFIVNLSNPSDYIDTIIKSYDDYMESIRMRIFIKYYPNVFFQRTLSFYRKILHNYPLTYDIVKDYFFLVKQENKLQIIIARWRQLYKNKIFWTKDIMNQVIHLKKLKETVLALFDGSKSSMYLHTKLQIYNREHVDQLVERLTKLFKLFKHNFFISNNINIILLDDFLYMSFSKMVEYCEYIFFKIIRILTNYINYFILYEIYIVQIEYLINPTSYINIDIEDVSSDIDDDELCFIIEKEYYS